MDASLPERTYETGLRRWIIVFTVITAAIMELIDTSIVNVALRTISGNLGATLSEVAWVITAYAISNIIMIPLNGFMSRWLGRKNYFLVSIVVFTIASFLCGNATSIWGLVFFRFVQGLGGGGLLTTAQTILVDTFPPKDLGKANAIFGIGIILGPTMGPTLGGYITDSLDWMWCFYVNIPVGILATFLAVRFLRDTPRDPNQKVDWLGIILLVVGVGSLQYVLEEGAAHDWFESEEIRYTCISAIVGLVGFVWWELRTPNPAVNLRILQKQSVAIGSGLAAMLGVGIFVPVFLFPVMVQSIFGWTATDTGEMLFPSALLGGVCIGMVGGMIRKGANPKIFMAMGFSFTALFCFSMFFTSPQAGYGDFHAILLLRGLGLGFSFVPISVLTITGLQGHEIAASAGLTNMVRQLGGAIGIALANVFVTQRTAVHRMDLISHITATDPVATQRIADLTQVFAGRGLNPEAARQAAFASLEGGILRQASLFSFNEAFMLTACLFMVVIPTIFLIPRSKSPVVADMSAAH